MLLRGILIGAGNALVLVLILVVSTLVSRPQSTAKDYRGLPGIMIPFFSGFGIGFVITMGCVVGAIYALVRYVQHAGHL